MLEAHFEENQVVSDAKEWNQLQIINLFLNL